MEPDRREGSQFFAFPVVVVLSVVAEARYLPLIISFYGARVGLSTHLPGFGTPGVKATP